MVQHGLIEGALVVLLLASSLLGYSLYEYTKLKEKASAEERRIEALDLKLKEGDQEIMNLKCTFTVNSKEIVALKGTVQETLGATNLIASQLFPAQPRPLKAVLKVQRVLRIMENGDCRFHETHLRPSSSQQVRPAGSKSNRTLQFPSTGSSRTLRKAQPQPALGHGSR